eukprot:2689037-Prymnesium_polylepis.1
MADAQCEASPRCAFACRRLSPLKSAIKSFFRALILTALSSPTRPSAAFSLRDYPSCPHAARDVVQP